MSAYVLTESKVSPRLQLPVDFCGWSRGLVCFVTLNLSLCSVESFLTYFFQKVFFQIPEFLRKVYIYFLRIYETSGFIPESILLFLAVFAKLHNRWRFIDSFTFSDDRNEKFAYFIGSAENFCLFPGIDWIKENHVLVCIKLFISKADKICLIFPVFLL